MSQTLQWAGWYGGLAIGLYALFQFWLTNKQLGCSLAYGNFCGFVSRASYFRTGEYLKLDNWRLWFILGIPLGGLVALLTTPGASFEWTFEMGKEYERIMPEADWLKALIVTLGGVMMGLGARMAGGCTSGHAIAGGQLLNPPSLLASALFFSGGLISAQTMFALFS
jgi:uncharacterized membrane protein YedE/YeeE